MGDCSGTYSTNTNLPPTGPAVRDAASRLMKVLLSHGFSITSVRHDDKATKAVDMYVVGGFLDK